MYPEISLNRITTIYAATYKSNTHGSMFWHVTDSTAKGTEQYV